MKKLKEERGSILVLAAISAVMLFSLMALSVDAGNLYFTQRQLQTLADSTAMAAALEIPACQLIPHNRSPAMVTAATTAFTEDNAPAGATLAAINNGPALAGDPNFGKATYVETVVTMSVPSYFARVFGTNTVPLGARAEAGYAVPAVVPSKRVWANTVELNGGNIKDAPGQTGGVYANSTAFADSGNISAPYTLNTSGSITGNCYNNGNSCGPPPTKVAAQPDPLSSSVEPAMPGISPTNQGTLNNGNNNCTQGGSNYTLCPGTYGSLNFNGGGYTVTFAPGLYYFTGALNGSAVTLSGSKVTFFFAGSGSLTTNSGEVWNLSPPSAADIAADTTHALYNNCTSCADMSIWQSAADSNLMIIDAGYNMTMQGNIYAPDAEVRMNGSGSITTTEQIVCKQLTLDAGTITINSSGAVGVSDGSQRLSLAE
jgi:Flp pilus assembly protein TadG